MWHTELRDVSIIQLYIDWHLYIINAPAVTADNQQPVSRPAVSEMNEK